jgi:hypothetical protein
MIGVAGGRVRFCSGYRVCPVSTKRPIQRIPYVLADSRNAQPFLCALIHHTIDLPHGAIAYLGNSDAAYIPDVLAHDSLKLSVLLAIPDDPQAKRIYHCTVMTA